MAHKLLKGTAAVLAGAAGAIAAGSYYFYKLAVPAHSNMKIKGSKEDEEKKKKDEERLAAAEKWLKAQPSDEFFTKSYDGLLLHAVWIPAETETKRTVIVVHGYRVSAAWDFGTIMPMYHDMGLNILAVDDRGHGISEGEYIGYGWQDHFDIMTWINEILRRFGNDSEIFVHGISMGAAAAMLTAGEELPPAVKGIIEDCGYTTLKEELDYCMHHYYKMPSGPFREMVSLFMKLGAGYSVKDVDCLKALRKATVPMLFIHGDQDTFVPTRMGYECYNACASADKKLVIIKGAGHALSALTDPERYRQVLKKFVEAH